MAKNRISRKRIRPQIVALGIMLGTGLSLLVFKFGQYLFNILRQPRVISRDIAVSLQDAAMLRSGAASIAATNLRAGIEKRDLLNGQEKIVLNAGWRNFREPWARDFGFASFGLLTLGEHRAARETLEAFLVYQKPTGQFPVKIHSTGSLDRYLHSLFRREQPTFTPLRPRYVTGHNTLSMDGNALLVIACLNYARIAGDHDFIRTHWSALKRAMLWLEEFALEEDGLLHQGVFADWADSIARQGRILYTNVVYWKALVDMAQAATIYGTSEDQVRFTEKFQQVAASISDHFWYPDLGYFVTHRTLDNLSSAGNLLAVAWNLVAPEQANAILDAMHAFDMASPVPTRVVHRPYPSKLIALENRLAGISYYHTDAAWLWLGAWHVIALARMGRVSEAQTLAHRIAEIIVRDGNVYEVYAPDGKYVSNLWYTSEAPLTWSAGMVVYAFQVLQEHLQR